MRWFESGTKENTSVFDWATSPKRPKITSFIVQDLKAVTQTIYHLIFKSHLFEEIEHYSGKADYD